MPEKGCFRNKNVLDNHTDSLKITAVSTLRINEPLSDSVITPQLSTDLTAEDKRRLIGYLWEQKRGKCMTTEPYPNALVISIPSPEVSVDQIFSGMLKLLEGTDPNYRYTWSYNWGRTHTIVNPSEELTMKFVDESLKKAHGYNFLNTSKLVEPTTKGTQQGEHNGKYFLVLNNQPSTIEGVILQSERMLDELVWCLSLKKREEGLSDIDAYTEALIDLRTNGFDYYFTDEDSLLNMWKDDPRYAIRLYGNVLKTGKVPTVIGAVGPLEANIHRPLFDKVTDHPEPTILYQTKTSESLNIPTNDEAYFAMGISVTKTPHVGHLLLASVLETTRRTFGKEAPIVINGNDTGPRIISTLAIASMRTGKEYDEIVSLITSGDIDSKKLELWYRERSQADTEAIISAQNFYRRNTICLRQQGENVLQIFQRFLPDTQLHLLLESNTEKEKQEILGLGLPQWKDSGLACLQIQNKLLVTQSDGIATAPTSRAAFMLAAATETGKGVPIYIDADNSITSALKLYSMASENNGVQFPGAAIGFDFEIASGTKANSLTSTEFLDWYEVAFPKSSAVDDLLFLVNTRYQLHKPNELPFFDYKDANSFLKDVIRSHNERETFIQYLANLKQEISDKTDHALDAPFINGSKNESAKIYHLLRNCQKAKKVLLGNSYELLFSKPEELFETSKTQRLIDLQPQDDLKRKTGSVLDIYTQLIKDDKELSSSLLQELQQHGYEGNELVAAVTRYVEGGCTMIKFRNILFRIVSEISTISKSSLSLNSITAELLIHLLSETEKRLLGQSQKKKLQNQESSSRMPYND